MPSLEEFKKLPWYKDRPQHIKDLIKLLPYAATVRIKATGQLAYVRSWYDDGTISVVTANGLFVVFGYASEEVELIQENPDMYL